MRFISEIGKVLDDLMSYGSPSGQEERVTNLFVHLISPYVDDVQRDIYGNVVAMKRGRTDKKLFLVAHADEVGLAIHYIDDNGFLYFKELGGIDTNVLPTQRVCIEGKNGPVWGVIGKKPIHLQHGEELQHRELTPSDLWIDIAAKNKKEAESLVDIGTIAMVVNTPVLMNNDVVGGRGLDDKIGMSVLILTAKELCDKQPDVTICFVATVQEELGGRGMQMLCSEYKPDVGLVIDVTHATDYPTVSVVEYGNIALGQGVVIAKGPNVYKGCSCDMVSVAQRNGIRHQFEVFVKPTGTDIASVQVSGINVETGLLCIPCRYMHTPNEMVSLRDTMDTIQLLVAYCLFKT